MDMLETDFEKFDPERAKRELPKFKNIRNLDPRTVSSMARQMSEGTWQVNGDSIRWNVKGEGIDGEHRLSAIVESGTTQWFVTIRKIPLNAEKTMDQPRGRNFSQYLNKRGVLYSGTVSKLCSFVQQEKLGHLVGRHNNQDRHYSLIPVLEKIYNENRDEVEKIAAKANEKMFDPFSVAKSFWAAMIWQFVRASSEEHCDNFMQSLAFGTYSYGNLKGQPLQKDDPINKLHEVLEGFRKPRKGIHDRTTLHAFFRKAWDCFLRGKEMKKLGWKRYGPSSEDFPALTTLKDLEEEGKEAA